MKNTANTANPSAQAGSANADHIWLPCVSWDEYCAIETALQDRPALRITYADGELEIARTSPRREFYAGRLGRFIEVAAEESRNMIEPRGNMTFQRADVACGLESDNCFWIEHEANVRGNLDWNPVADPPPDLVIEIEITPSVLDRMRVYSALGVPQVWRFDGSTLAIMLRRSDGCYEMVERSPTFPGLPPKGIIPFLEPSEAVDYLGRIRQFRAWVREQLGKKETT